MTSLWRATVLTIFPEMFPGPLGLSLAGKALAENKWQLGVMDIRDFATDKHRSVDDTPAGGGAGMVMRADIAAAAIDAARAGSDPGTPAAPSPKIVCASSPKVPAPFCCADASKALISACSTRATSRRCRSAIMCCRAANSPRKC
jgi:tRNA G37 N-methylase TrmD